MSSKLSLSVSHLDHRLDQQALDDFVITVPPVIVVDVWYASELKEWYCCDMLDCV